MQALYLFIPFIRAYYEKCALKNTRMMVITCVYLHYTIAKKLIVKIQKNY